LLEWKAMSDDASPASAVRRIAQQLECELAQLAPLADERAERGDLYSRLAAVLNQHLGELAALEFWGPANQVLSSELWNRSSRWLARGWLQNRARTKPRGYAGDYELLARIYRNWRCSDPLGELFDRYFQEQAAPRAVAHRMQMTADWIAAAARQRLRHCARERCLHAAMVGSAFGLEVRDALVRLEGQQCDALRFSLLDLDPAAIEFAQEQLRPQLKPACLSAVACNLFRLPERPQLGELLSNAHLIVCPGLFDYLDDADAAAMLRALYTRLAPGGRLTVFQFAPHNPTRAYMEWIANWYLVYRDVPQLRQVVESAGLAGAAAEYGAEPLGVDLFVTLVRPAE
jgi:SAM-dependent methyltransferase